MSTTKAGSTGRLKGRSPLAKGAGFLEEFTKDEVKSRVDIIALMESFGIKLEKKGSSWMGLCPFHEDKNPSLSVDQSKGLYNCFGCGEGGDAFDLVMKIRGGNFPEALRFLEDFSGSPGPPAFSSKPPEPPQNEKPKHLMAEVSLSDIIRAYRKDLEASKEAQGYLKSRGLMIPDILGRLDVGFSAGAIIERTSKEQQTALKASGLISTRGKEHFAGCITVPLRDYRDNPVALYGRRVGERNPKHLYQAGPHRGLFNPAAYKAYPDRMIWTESIIDAMSLMALGFENVDALYGTNGITDDHIMALKEGRTKELILAFDNDEAGRRSAAEVPEKLKELNIRTAEIFPPDTVGDCPVKDWNEFLVKSGTDGKSTIDALIEEAVLVPVDQLVARPAPVGLQVSEKNGRYTATSNLADAQIVYTIIGVKEGFISSLKVNIRATRDDRKHIDNVDLFSARSRSIFASQLSRIFDIESARVEKDLVDILEYLESQRDQDTTCGEAAPEMTPQEKTEGLALLQDPDLFDRIEEDLEELGYVGESVNKRLMYIAASSRKMNSPISIIVHSQSASGKSYLIDTVKKLMPPEDVLSMTSLSDQALNYMEEDALIHKFLTMGEAVHSEQIEYQLREMLSGGELSRLVTTKDEKTGRMVSRMVRKKVVVAMVMSTTSNDINEENASRSFLISTDETKEQTEAIHRRQRQKYSHEAHQRREQVIPAIVRRHQAAQRLLEPRMIINPFAEYLEFPSSQMRTRRDHERFIDLIAAVCFLRQYQKGATGTFLECDIEDYRIAYQIMNAILPSTLGELPSSAARLFEEAKGLIETRARELDVLPSEVWITQRDLREYTGLGHDLVKKNLRILADWEYVRVRGNTRGMTRRYSLGSSLAGSSDNLLPSPQSIEKKLEGLGPGGAVEAVLQQVTFI